MINAESIQAAEQRRLAWRCRRGMLELDIILQQFVSQYFTQLTLNELAAFDTFLAMSDHELWQVLGMKNLHLQSESQQSIIDKLHHMQSV
ncbi:MAG: succinate dehydrogenase assembly factor 2 [Methylophilaceae bacterium]|nr:succinate dehydrogenase assembly factor 2 [Methylophilaceae bacterium]MDG1821596.1 succinate dehydrogenase assembly factor 2 [Methylophilaceae bacterium]MDG2293438.1 succinate dehydrogenase assembly factor 2 [Methylophilaceae bacterium]